MTETPREPVTQPVATTEPAPAAVAPTENKPSRLMQALAWVGIAAGTVFIVAVVFGTGFFLGAHSGDGYGHHHRGGHDRGGMMMFHRGGPDGGPGRMGPPHGMMPPWGPGPGPGSFGPGGPGSGSERSETPATPAPPARP